jgi:hypothetical protein
VALLIYMAPKALSHVSLGHRPTNPIVWEPSAENAIQPGASFGPLHGTGVASQSRFQR